MSRAEASTTYVLGVDVGGTKTRVALVRLATAPGGATVPGPGSPVEIIERHEGPSSAGSQDAVDVIESGVIKMIERAGLDRPVSAIGVGVAGYLDLGGILRVVAERAGPRRNRPAGAAG